MKEGRDDVPAFFFGVDLYSKECRPLDEIARGRNWRLRCCNCAATLTESVLDGVGGSVETARLSDHFLEKTGLVAVAGIAQHQLNRVLQPFGGKVRRLHEFAHSMVFDTGSDTGLIITDRDRHHGYTIRQGFQSRVETGVRDT